MILLYPVVNQYRNKISLNGLWKFAIADDFYDVTKPIQDYRLIGVPSSYNDLFTEKKIRDHVGTVVYENTIEFPDSTIHNNWFLRIGAAGNRCKVYLDGLLIYTHNGGFLPIDCSIPRKVTINKYRLTILLNNRLDYQTLPIGEIIDDKQIIHYDFRNYTGIHRDSFLYSKPNHAIEDIYIETNVFSKYAEVKYQVFCENECIVKLFDPNDIEIGISHGNKGMIHVNNPKLWDIGKGYLYRLEVSSNNDLYSETFGIRTIEVFQNKLLLNGREVYLKGFGMHEDHEIIGKGSFTALNIRDYNLLQWIGANSFRTSHYPYAEEMYELADRYGILVINEMPAVGLNFWSGRTVFAEGVVDNKTLEVYKQQFLELYARDKNHPSVIMYSLANEANTHEAGAFEFFNEVVRFARSKTNLPLMIVEWVGAKENKVAQLADVIGLNRYIGWYSDFGDLDIVPEKLRTSLQEYFDTFNKPILLSEFGADTLAGLHKLPSVPFSEEFQVEFISKYQEVIKDLDFIIGEHVWNFADFDTKPGITRVDGNKKGVFTRNRQPKMVAHILREKWIRKS